MIRDFLKQNAGEKIASAIRIIYGGSVKEDNCLEIIHKPDVDGFLIGGASLKPSFKEIIEITN